MMNQVKVADETQVVEVEQVGSDVVRIGLKDGVDPNEVIDELQASFDTTFQQGIHQVVFDMENVEFPNGSFIAMLIGRSMEARREGGDVRIIGLSETAQSHFSIFTPLTYLSIGTDEGFVLRDFEEAAVEEIASIEEGKPICRQVLASVESLHGVTDFIAPLAQKVGMEPIDVSKLKIAVYEACMNVVEHGYRFEPGHFLGIEVLWEKGRFQVTITDRGESFDFYALKPYDVKKAFDQKRRGGFGLYIIQRSVDEITYESDAKTGNRLTLIKKL